MLWLSTAAKTVTPIPKPKDYLGGPTGLFRIRNYTRTLIVEFKSSVECQRQLSRWIEATRDINGEKVALELAGSTVCAPAWEMVPYRVYRPTR